MTNILFGCIASKGERINIIPILAMESAVHRRTAVKVTLRPNRWEKGIASENVQKPRKAVIFAMINSAGAFWKFVSNEDEGK